MGNLGCKYLKVLRYEEAEALKEKKKKANLGAALLNACRLAHGGWGRVPVEKEEGEKAWWVIFMWGLSSRDYYRSGSVSNAGGDQISETQSRFYFS